MAIVGYRQVTGCTSLSDLFSNWDDIMTNDFWGTPMSHSASHKSWRPLTTLTFRAGWCAHGSDVFPFHVVNTVLHVVATTLFQALCETVVFHNRIVQSRRLRRSLAWVAGMLYGVHPIHVECVTNIVGRAEPLSAIFFLLSVFAFRWAGGWVGGRAVAARACV
jgi:hypothetical protein